MLNAVLRLRVVYYSLCANGDGETFQNIFNSKAIKILRVESWWVRRSLFYSLPVISERGKLKLESSRVSLIVWISNCVSINSSPCSAPSLSFRHFTAKVFNSIQQQCYWYLFVFEANFLASRKSSSALFRSGLILSCLVSRKDQWFAKMSEAVKARLINV